jgi:hypothetical protein
VCACLAVYKIISLSFQLSEANSKIQELQDKIECLQVLLNESDDKFKDMTSTLILLQQSKTNGGDSKESVPSEKELVRSNVLQ